MGETKIIPTVGRMVYYKSRGSADGAYPPTIFASIITGVHESGSVSLATFSPSGLRFEVDVLNGEDPGQWDWMPYQKGQAKKTEELEDELKASEALYGFAGWLTSRSERTVMSATHDAAIVADLVKEYCEANNLENPRDGWETNLIHPPIKK